MDRLTFEGDFCTIAMCRENPCPYDNSCTQREVWERLRAYEDTGLEPEEVAALREQESNCPEIEAVKNQWIPVTERLPESGGTYIVRSDRGSIYTSHFYPPRKSRIGIYGGNWTPRGKTTVTHWMPLPEPPKEV